MRVEPEKTLPKLLAQVHVQVAEEVIQAIASNLPNQFRKISAQDQAAMDAESKFFKRWPKLKDEKFKSDILEITSIYRQKNPKASLEEAINKVGALVSVQHGLPIQLDQDQDVVISPKTGTKSQGLGKGLVNQPRAEARQRPKAQSEPNFFENWAEEIIQGKDD